jgi:hypothetical protein
MYRQSKSSKHATLRSIVFIAVGCILFTVAVPTMAQEQAVVPEKNPPGDIPDSQVFVTYKSPNGFQIKVPEGWARSDRKNGIRFADKFNAINLEISQTAEAPTVASVRSQQASELEKSGRAVKIQDIKRVVLPSGPAVVIIYESNSEPNPVTHKQLRLESNRYLVFRNSKLATLDLSAPRGADNVDQWQLISRSFRWN